MQDTEWFAKCGWGVFCHYLTSPQTTADDWNRQVAAFDVPGLARQLQSVHARYFFITIGQGSGHFCAPNETYDELTGIQPSKCSRRDLVSDLHAELDLLGIRLLVYTAAEIAWADMPARVGLKLEHHHNDPGSGGVKIWWKHRQVPFMRNIEAIHREWATRWGRKVSGWWVDGCYEAAYRFPDGDPPNFETLAAALRSGNPDAIVAFNPGVVTPVIHYSDHENFTAGEISEALPECKGPFVTGPSGHADRYHVLSYLGESWCKGQPRFPDALVCGYTQHVIGKGGVVTWDVPIQKNGLIPESFVRQLGSIGAAVAER